mmetsp:Transcript_121851/g.389662  ORF Transcript_121851/g.389662 Transcript_121851/m.389662 type:complete len:273 (-) Transcript_121851:493-1311(-)
MERGLHRRRARAKAGGRSASAAPVPHHRSSRHSAAEAAWVPASPGATGAGAPWTSTAPRTPRPRRHTRRRSRRRPSRRAPRRSAGRCRRWARRTASGSSRTDATHHGRLRCGPDKSSGVGLHAEFAARQRATSAKPGGIQQDDHADTAHSAVCPRWGLSGRPGGAALESRLLRAAWAPTRVLCPEAHAYRPRRAPGRHARCLPAPRLLRAAGLQLQGLLRGHQHRGHFQRRRRARMLRLLFGGVSGRRSCAADAGVPAPLPRGLRAAVLADA